MGGGLRSPVCGRRRHSLPKVITMRNVTEFGENVIIAHYGGSSASQNPAFCRLAPHGATARFAGRGRFD